MSLISIRDLRLAIGATPILNGIDLDIGAGEIVGLVGESGSGKSLTALSILQLLPPGARLSGSIRFEGREMLALDEDALCDLRGDEIGMVFQEPMAALNPLKTIGEQIAEGIRWHRGASRSEAADLARAMLARVGLPPERFSPDRYPHELSGGQRQRVVIAIACALRPKLLIADEPTTALDVVVQAQILALLRDLVAENGMGLLLISHDLAVVADMADRIAIMRAGTIVDGGPAAETLAARRHPYTGQLAAASLHSPERKPAPAAADGPPLLSVRDLSRHYRGRSPGLFAPPPVTRAVDGVSFDIAEGRSVALVGRSGCGKSTVARLILALDRPTAGTIHLAGRDLTDLPVAELRPYRRMMQVVFQDPYGSFDPRQKIWRLVSEPLHLVDEALTRADRRERAAAALAEVGLSPDDLDKYPHEFSGGQRQRLSIARAIITRPRLIVCDEPVSALDVSIRARILDLLADLNQRLGIAYLFITHDLHVARAITDEVLVMHEGRIVERGPTEEVLTDPRSEPARDLVRAAPLLDRILARRLRPTA